VVNFAQTRVAPGFKMPHGALCLSGPQRGNHVFPIQTFFGDLCRRYRGLVFAGFCQQVINGATPTALSPTGVTAGVAMTGQGGGGTLIVGTIGGPEQIFLRTIQATGS
jgi:hypothetical protein